MYFIVFNKKSQQNPILIWWAWQQIIFILVGQIKPKKKKSSVSCQQLLLGVLNSKYVTISVSCQPTSQL